MSHNKFVLYNKFFHLSDNKLEPDNKLNKIKSFYSHVKKNWNKYLSPGTFLTIDEGVAPFLGVSKYKQYMPAKPKRWGLKVYMLSDSITHYTFSATLYTGQSENTGNYTTKLVISLLNGFFWKGHRLFIDSYYTSPKLIKQLYFLDTYVTGMTRNNRKGLPKFKSEELALQVGETRTFVNEYMHLDVFKARNRFCYILSNVYSNREENNKPESLVKYGEYMNGVDKMNQKCSYYRFPHRQKKWWKAYFYQLLEISIVNAYILYKLHGGKCTHKDFRMQIVHGLLADSGINNASGAKTKDYRHSSRKKHYIDYLPNKIRKYCLLCKVKKTCWMCKKCNVKRGITPLCSYPCFGLYHLEKKS